MAIRPMADVFRDARKLIEKPENWIKGGFYPYDQEPDVATCMCTAGAIGMAGAGFADQPPADLLGAFIKANKIRQRGWHYEVSRVGEWNDAKRRTHADVLTGLDRAAAYAEQHGLTVEVRA